MDKVNKNRVNMTCDFDTKKMNIDTKYLFLLINYY